MKLQFLEWQLSISNCCTLSGFFQDKMGTAHWAPNSLERYFLEKGLLKERGKKSTCLFKTICRSLKLFKFVSQVKSIKSPSSKRLALNRELKKKTLQKNCRSDPILLSDPFRYFGGSKRASEDSLALSHASQHSTTRWCSWGTSLRTFFWTLIIFNGLFSIMIRILGIMIIQQNISSFNFCIQKMMVTF